MCGCLLPTLILVLVSVITEPINLTHNGYVPGFEWFIIINGLF